MNDKLKNDLAYILKGFKDYGTAYSILREIRLDDFRLKNIKRNEITFIFFHENENLIYEFQDNKKGALYVMAQDNQAFDRLKKIIEVLNFNKELGSSLPVKAAPTATKKMKI